MSFAAMRHRLAFAGGTSLLRKERWWPAAFLLGRAAKLAPTHWESHNNLAVAFLKLRRWEDAARVAERAISLDPRAVDSHDFLGIALLQLERWDAAVAAYRHAIAVDPVRYDSYDRLGMALSRLARWEEVVATYEAALKLDAGRYAAHQRLGLALLQLRRWDAAAAAFRRAIELASTDPTAAGELAGLELSLAAAVTERDAKEGTHNPPPVAAVIEQFARRQAAFWTPENLGADVFVVEQWLKQLAVVPEQVKPGPRLLFVLDNDFGELATVKYFVLGQELSARTSLLLPDRLYVHNVDAIPGRTHRYASVDDILHMVDREQTDIVFLCSAYLLWEHLAFTHEDVERLIDQLRSRGCRVVTADPYLGMLSKQDPRTLLRVDIPSDHPQFTVEQLTAAKRPDEEKMWAGYARAEQILRDTYHLYPSYCDVAANDLAETDERNIAFFNDRLLRPAVRKQQGAVTPHWLFILGTPDCHIQELFERKPFVDVVAAKLLETRAAGRHPILIGPKAFVDELIPRMPVADGIDIVSQCPFTQFYSLLLSAEHAFYWNVVSHSLLIRFYNKLPIVQYDLGHLVRTAPAIFDRIVDWYYQGFEPPLRSHQERLTLQKVEEWAAEYRQQAARLVERYRRAPGPEQMIADIMRRPISPMSMATTSLHVERSTPE